MLMERWGALVGRYVAGNVDAVMKGDENAVRAGVISAIGWGVAVVLGCIGTAAGHMAVVMPQLLSYTLLIGAIIIAYAKWDVILQHVRKLFDLTNGEAEVRLRVLLLGWLSYTRVFQFILNGHRLLEVLYQWVCVQLACQHMAQWENSTAGVAIPILHDVIADVHLTFTPNALRFVIIIKLLLALGLFITALFSMRQALLQRIRHVAPTSFLLLDRIELLVTLFLAFLPLVGSDMLHEQAMANELAQAGGPVPIELRWPLAAGLWRLLTASTMLRISVCGLKMQLHQLLHDERAWVAFVYLQHDRAYAWLTQGDSTSLQQMLEGCRPGARAVVSVTGALPKLAHCNQVLRIRVQAWRAMLCVFVLPCSWLLFRFFPPSFSTGWWLGPCVLLLASLALWLDEKQLQQTMADTFNEKDHTIARRKQVEWILGADGAPVKIIVGQCISLLQQHRHSASDG
jgi:hypothetical protein